MPEKFYLTTSIIYTNAAPHLGFAYELTLADAIARYERTQKKDVFFLTGTDEHGAKIARTAKEKGVSLQAFVDTNAKHVENLAQKLAISNDGFIRTSDKEMHWPGAIALWRALEAAGDIYKKKYQGYYCMGHEAFHPENGLVNGECPDYPGRKLELVEEENYFFRLSKYADAIKEKLVSRELAIIPESRTNELLSVLEEGLEDVSFSRLEEAIPWGIPVPGDPAHTMYVWCDALSNYITAMGYGRDEKQFARYWPADLHIIGKDILRFHALIWPGMLLAANLPLPKRILVHGFITVGGKKMSKSIGNVVDPSLLVERYGTEAIRYFLLRELSPFEDGDFTEEKFVERYNADLANGLGNLMSRVLKMAETYFNGSVSPHNPESAPLKSQSGTILGGDLTGWSIPYLVENKLIAEYRSHFDGFEVHKAAEAVWKFIQELDGYVAAYEPFKLIKTDKVQTEDIIWNLLYGLTYVADLVQPFIPETSVRMKELIGAEWNEQGEPVRFRTKPVEGPLFARIEI